jgi:hypothetical protein
VQLVRTRLRQDADDHEAVRPDSAEKRLVAILNSSTASWRHCVEASDDIICVVEPVIVSDPPRPSCQPRR